MSGFNCEISGKATINAINVRSEFHGDDRALGVDVKVTVMTDLNVLAMFSPTLRAFLYEEPEGKQPILRESHLQPLRYDLKAENHTVHLSDETYDGCTVDKFELLPEQYGAIALSFKVSVSGFDPEHLPKLAGMLLDQVAQIEIDPVQGDLLKS